MQRIEIRATDDKDEEVTLVEVRDEQVVTTTDGPIVYKIQPQFFGPHGDVLVKEEKGVFRSPTGERFRRVTFQRDEE